jgi:hypothetical protein
MNKLLATLALIAAVVGGFSIRGEAQAQVTAQTVATCGSASYTSGYPFPLTVDTTGKECVNATVSATATFTGFTPTTPTVNVTATTGGAAVAFTSGSQIVVYNSSSTVTAYVSLATSGTISVTTGNGIPIPPGQQMPFATGANTYLQAITSSSTAALYVTSASAGTYASGWGGGGGSGGGGGGAAYGPTAVGAAVANPPIINGYQDGSGNVAVVTPTAPFPVTDKNLPTTVDTNTGAAGASTLRVVPATGSTVTLGGTLPAYGSTPTFNCGTGCGSPSPFTPLQPTVALTAGTTTSNSAITSAGTQLLVYNASSTVTAYVNLGTTSGVTATTTATPIPPGQTVPLAIGSNTYLAAITASGSAALYLTSGTGSLSSGWGGSGGAGSGLVGSNSNTLQQGTGPAGANSLNVVENTLEGAINNAIPTGSNIIGKVGIDQTTPGTTNGVQDASTGTTGSAIPSKGTFIAANGSGNLTGVVTGDTTLNWPSITTATTTQLIAGVSSKKIYVTHLFLNVSGADTVTLEYGTNANCAAGTTTIAGPFNYAANGGSTEGAGLGPVLIVPASDYFCVVTSAAVTLGGNLTYTQF